MHNTIPRSDARYKMDTLRIAARINEMKKNGLISDLNSGWLKVTDMLRATCFCTTAAQMLNCIERLYGDNHVSILRIKPRLGAAEKNLNCIDVNYGYRGRMICELKIQLGSQRNIFYYSSRFLQEIQRVCDS